MPFTYTCEVCGTEFIRAHSPESRPNRFCTKKCKGQTMKSTDADFWARVDTSGGPRACWPWTGSISSGNIGYGTLKFQGEYEYAHRVAWRLRFNEAPERQVMHRCDDPLCCNPLHLMLGTQADNNADAHAKGRGKGHDGPPLHPEYNALSRFKYATRKSRKLDKLAEND